jgi:hypothetical protein
VAALTVAIAAFPSACGSGSGSKSAATIATTTVPAPTQCAPHIDPPPVITTIDATTLVIPDGVDSLLVCRYSGSNTPQAATPGQPGQLQQSALVTDPAAIAAMAAAVNDGPPLLSGAHSCPMDDGRSYELTFHYVAGPMKVVDVEASGCRSVQAKTKGHAATTGLLDQLTATVGAAV